MSPSSGHIWQTLLLLFCIIDNFHIKYANQMQFMLSIYAKKILCEFIQHGI